MTSPNQKGEMSAPRALARAVAHLHRLPMRSFAFALLLAVGSVNRPGCGGSGPKTYPPCPEGAVLVAACAGKTCGAACDTGGGGICGSGFPASPGRCDAIGDCIPDADPPPLCAASPECAGQSCGAPCDACGGACPSPVPGACDYGGWCVAPTAWTCYDPCAGKSCGASCTVCPPGATRCAEPPVAKNCDMHARCVTDVGMIGCP